LKEYWNRQLNLKESSEWVHDPKNKNYDSMSSLVNTTGKKELPEPKNKKLKQAACKNSLTLVYESCLF